MILNSRRLRWTLGPVLSLLLISSCSRSNDTSVLEGKEWILLSLNGQDVITGSTLTLNFVDGTIRGSAGCNAYRSMSIGNKTDTYTATADGRLTFPGVMITEKDCPALPGVMQQELAYIDALRQAAVYRVVDNRLEIDDGAGKTILVFTTRE